MAGSRKRKSPGVCKHDRLYIECSGEAGVVGFARPPPERRLAAATHAGRFGKNGNYSTAEADFNNGDIFPGPLVLPDDALAIDPNYPAQSFKGMQQALGPLGLQISPRRNVIYVVPPPTVTDEMQALMGGWDDPCVPEDLRMNGLPEKLGSPSMSAICDYLKAFYYPLEVKLISSPMKFVPWQDRTKRSSKQYIGLTVPSISEMVRVRYRPAPDGVAVQQLNLNDILDSIVGRVPDDGCAMIMVMDHDLYEDDDDDFCCGRAYGGSRISLVSSFRYHCGLDNYAGIDLDHMWPASHCVPYVDRQCKVNGRRSRKAIGATPRAGKAASSPIAAAVAVSRSSLAPKTQQDWEGLWFSRVVRTLSHELGHCFGMDHCNYFACVMQGTASVAEDVRQPPYLCPVCLQKVSWSLATLTGDGSMINLQRLWIKKQHEALRTFCVRWKHVGMFAAMGEWLAGRLEAMQDQAGQDSL